MPELLTSRANETISGSLGSLVASRKVRPDPSPERWASSQRSVVREPLVRLPAELFPVYEQLQELKHLQPNWDSYGAVPISEVAINRALELLADLQWTGPLPSVAPTAPGGVHFEWGGEDEGVEINIRVDGNVSVLFDIAGQMRESQVQSWTDPLLNEALGWAARLA